MKKTCIVLMIMVFSTCAAYADILIIANKEVPETALTQEEIQKIFLGKTVKWQDSSRIRFVILKDVQIHGLFLRQYLKKSNAKWKSYWKRMVFAGSGVAPKSINTEAEMIDIVSKTEGAIGYISTVGLPDNAENKPVKILNIGR